MSSVKRTRGEKNILLKNPIYMDRHERNVHVMKGKMKGIYLCFLLWNITTGLILSCIQLRYIVYEKNPPKSGNILFFNFQGK